MRSTDLSPHPCHPILNGESLSNKNHDIIVVSGRKSNISSAMAFHLCYYIILCNKRVLYLVVLKLIYDVLMKSKCQILKSGSCCSFGLQVSPDPFFLSLLLNKVHRYYLQFGENNFLAIPHFPYKIIAGASAHARRLSGHLQSAIYLLQLFYIVLLEGVHSMLLWLSRIALLKQVFFSLASPISAAVTP